jgi:hypothetical protein
VIVDAESENVVIAESKSEKGSENVVMVESENEKANAVIAIWIGNAAIGIGSIVTEKGRAVTEKGKKENALKKNVSAVKCPEQTLYILRDRSLQYRPRYSFWL